MQLMIDTDAAGVEELNATVIFLGSLVAAREKAPTINGDAAPIQLTPEPVRVVTTPSAGPTGVPLPPPPPPVSGTVLAVAPVSIPAPPGPQPGADRDIDGVAWDRNLHTSTKAKTIDGRWKPRKPRSPTPPAAPAPAAPLGPMGGVSIPPPPPVLPPSGGDDDIDVEPDAPDQPAGVPAAPAPPAIDFPTFISKLTAASTAGTITQKRIDEVMAQFGLASLFSLSAQPQTVVDVARAFGFV